MQTHLCVAPDPASAQTSLQTVCQMRPGYQSDTWPLTAIQGGRRIRMFRLECGEQMLDVSTWAIFMVSSTHFDASHGECLETSRSTDQCNVPAIKGHNVLVQFVSIYGSLVTQEGLPRSAFRKWCRRTFWTDVAATTWLLPNNMWHLAHIDGGIQIQKQCLYKIV